MTKKKRRREREKDFLARKFTHNTRVQTSKRNWASCLCSVKLMKFPKHTAVVFFERNQSASIFTVSCQSCLSPMLNVCTCNIFFPFILCCTMFEHSGYTGSLFLLVTKREKFRGKRDRATLNRGHGGKEAVWPCAQMPVFCIFSPMQLRLPSFPLYIDY